MKKEARYRGVRFDSEAIHAGVVALRALCPDLRYGVMKVDQADGKWTLDTFEEFMVAADHGDVYFSVTGERKRSGQEQQYRLMVTTSGSEYGSCVDVDAPTREEILAVLRVFDAHVERCRLKEDDKAQSKIFIGHGRSPAWRDLKNHLQDQHHYEIGAYETEPRAGYPVAHNLEQMLEDCDLALLVMTGEDETKDKKLRARQNVVYEIGLFQGRLGFDRAIVLLEEGCEDFSNISGLQQIRFKKGNIAGKFGDVLAVLKREIG
jgi:Predicted nucleotide-binding protein containing TIR-like domain